MISYIDGQLKMVGTDHIILDHEGIGFQIFVPASTLNRMPARGSMVKIYTHLYVREDRICLYGFLTRDELEVFDLLISVSGIGPKSALGILSTLSPDELRMAILAEDTKTLSKAPGVGNKTARRLILDLKDKLKLGPKEEPLPSTEASDAGEVTGNQKEAVLALVALGYSQTEALQAVGKCPITSEMGTDEILKLALKQLI